MKKLLMGTAAAALSLSAFGAQAQNVTFEVGGFFTGGVGFVDVDADSGDFDVADPEDNVALIRDSEINFVGEIVSDNGITFGFETQLEAGDRDEDVNDADELSGGDSVIDENFMYVQGPFGTFELGEEDGAADGYMGSGNVSGPFTSAADGGGLLFDFYADVSPVNIASNGGDTGDSLKVSYFTPNFSGFSAGVSYVPNGGQENGRQTALTSQNHAFELGAGYAGTFSGVSVGIGGGWVSDITPNRDDDQSAAGGVKIGYAGAELGVNYGWRESGGAGGEDRNTIGVGVGYGTGPWEAGIDFGYVIDGTNEDDFGVALGVGYALAPGVLVGATVEYAQSDADSDTPSSEDREAFATGVFLGLGF